MHRCCPYAFNVEHYVSGQPDAVPGHAEPLCWSWAQPCAALLTTPEGSTHTLPTCDLSEACFLRPFTHAPACWPLLKLHLLCCPHSSDGLQFMYPISDLLRGPSLAAPPIEGFLAHRLPALHKRNQMPSQRLPGFERIVLELSLPHAAVGVLNITGPLHSWSWAETLPHTVLPVSLRLQVLHICVDMQALLLVFGRAAAPAPPAQCLDVLPRCRCCCAALLQLLVLWLCCFEQALLS